MGDFEVAGPRYLFHDAGQEVPVGTVIVRYVELVERLEEGRLIRAAATGASELQTSSGGLLARIRGRVDAGPIPVVQCNEIQKSNYLGAVRHCNFWGFRRILRGQAGGIHNGRG